METDKLGDEFWDIRNHLRNLMNQKKSLTAEDHQDTRLTAGKNPKDVTRDMTTRSEENDSDRIPNIVPSRTGKQTDAVQTRKKSTRKKNKDKTLDTLCDDERPFAEESGTNIGGKYGKNLKSESRIKVDCDMEEPSKKITDEVRRFFNVEGHPLMIPNLNLLSRDELITLDNYLRKQADLRPGDLLCTAKDRYSIVYKVNEGRFSAIYLSESKDKEEYFCIKTEMRRPQYFKRLKNEVNVMSTFEKAKDQKANRLHFPRLIDSGRAGQVLFLVTTMLSFNLSKLCKECGGKFSKLSAVYLIFETFKAVRDMHHFAFIHRDIKPSNFCIGLSNRYKRVFIIDFGSTKKYDPKNPNKSTRNSLLNGICIDEGSLTYASVDVHRGDAPCPRTDLESWFYMCCEWISGKPLPWKGERAEERVLKMKEQFLKERGGDYVKEIKMTFREMIDYILGLKFDTVVDYNKIRDMIKTCVVACGGQDNNGVDWEQLPR